MNDLRNKYLYIFSASIPAGIIFGLDFWVEFLNANSGFRWGVLILPVCLIVCIISYGKLKKSRKKTSNLG